MSIFYLSSALTLDEASFDVSGFDDGLDSETFSAADQAFVNLLFTRLFDEGFNTSVSRTFDNVVGFEEAVLAAVTRKMFFPVFVDEGFQLNDGFTPTWVYALLLGACTLDDAQFDVSGFDGCIDDENAQVTDTLNTVLIKIVSFVESFNSSDGYNLLTIKPLAESLLVDLNRALDVDTVYSESTDVSDSISNIFTAIRTLTESFNTDPQRLLDFTTQFSESLLTEASLALKAIIDLEDSGNVSDDVTTLLTHIRLLTEAFLTSVNRTMDFVQSPLQEAYSLAVQRYMLFSTSKTEATSVTDSISDTLTFIRQFNETWGTSATRNVLPLLLYSEAVAVGITRTMGSFAVRTEGVNVDDEFQAQFAYLLMLGLCSLDEAGFDVSGFDGCIDDESFGTSDSLNVFITFIRVFAEALGVSTDKVFDASIFREDGFIAATQHAISVTLSTFTETVDFDMEFVPLYLFANWYRGLCTLDEVRFDNDGFDECSKETFEVTDNFTREWEAFRTYLESFNVTDDLAKLPIKTILAELNVLDSGVFEFLIRRIVYDDDLRDYFGMETMDTVANELRRYATMNTEGVDDERDFGSLSFGE